MVPLKWVPLIGICCIPAVHAGDVVDTLLQEYRAQGSATFDAQQGERLWQRSFGHDRQPRSRQCASCHTADPRQGGKHARTGKAIGPLAPAVDGKRLTDIAKIRKWLKRNCKWTLGRECTAQEKGDVLTYLMNL